ncbi:hypothetical protein EVJ58_g1608 [Rhodofomes roseus]|uniref:ATP-dependent DNA helicase n=1 Tax=Rhodofomes roseus TaxID=34475 RepID=A0A4Y9Z0L1_9APHY|nr:hypothetical protein EVJ58_g1608 [Rhodofomes roseus]
MSAHTSVGADAVSIGNTAHDAGHPTPEEQRAAIAVLTVREIMAVIGSRACVPARLQHRKSDLVDIVLSLPSDVKDDVIEAARTKRERAAPGTPESRKRQREAQRQRERRVRVRIEESTFGEDVAMDGAHEPETGAPSLSQLFLQLPTEEERHKLYRGFYDATTSARLEEKTCAVCARRQNTLEAGMEDLRIADMPNQHRLQPSQPHAAHHLTQGMLLVPEGCRDVGGIAVASICRSCRRDLAKQSNAPVRLSLANGLWVGDVPWQLLRLTFPEQLLIAHLYPRVFVVKLYPKDRRGHSPETLQSALAGNVTTFAFNMDKIADMIDGRLMPQRPAILASVLSVTYIGSHKIPQQWLKSTFTVRRGHVGEALRWLKENNPKYYGDVVIDAERMESLPEDGVPVEILANLHQEEHVDIVDVENDTYVPDCDAAPDDDGETYIYNVNFESKTLFLGVMDTDLSQISLPELMQWGLENLSSNGAEGRYLVSHGRRPVADFTRQSDLPGGAVSEEDEPNFWEKAYPVLFPYGRGGIEGPRRVKVPFLEHVQWLLQYHDRRFRKHPTFTFLACSTLQRRQALGSARIQMRRSDFLADATLLSRITIDDLTVAAEEEASGQQVSNAAVRLLKKRVNATASRVAGSDASRVALRSQIWSTSAWLNPANVWITINPDDLHDPIAQVFVGEQIDMDAFLRTAGPDKGRRARNIASDGFAAAQFFHFTIGLVLETLFGLKVKPGGRLESKVGVLGHLAAYFGTVECQGRGTLHLHLLLWLKGSPSPTEMREWLRDAAFRERVKAYISANFRASIPGASSSAEVLALPKDAEIAYGRPIHPEQEEYWHDVEALEAVVARTKQLHVCGPGCLVIDRVSRQPRCKRRAPWPLSDEDVVSSDGHWSAKRTFGFLNTWVPAITHNLRCNNDGKLLTNSKETNNITFYITNYTAKKQGKTYNSSALWAKGLLYHFEDTSYVDELRERQRLLIFRAVNVLNREQELPAPMAVSYLMGWGDMYRSHHYTAIYWTSFVSVLLRTFPELRQRRDVEPTAEASVETVAVQRDTEANVEDASESYLLTTTSSGHITLASQVEDYTLRGRGLENKSVVSFFVDTYEQSIGSRRSSVVQQESTSVVDQPPRRGRPASDRCAYLVNHPRHDNVVRVVRGIGHNTLPNFVGTQFPRNDDVESYNFYCASMLLLFKPWRAICSDLKGADESWSDSFTRFQAEAPKSTLDCLDSIQHYHACKAAAEADESSGQDAVYHGSGLGGGAGEEDEDRAEMDNAENGSVLVNVTPEMVQAAWRDSLHSNDHGYGVEAVDVGKGVGLFCNVATVWKPSATVGTVQHVNMIEQWRRELTQRASQLAGERGELAEEDMGNVEAMVAVDLPAVTGNGDVLPSSTGTAGSGRELGAIDVAQLKDDQLRSYDIVSWHLGRTIAYLENRAERPPQLLKQLQGEGGTGKSKVIQTITNLFSSRGVRHMLLKCAYTGIAASLVDGKTTHSVAGISMNGRGMSDEKKRRLTGMWSRVSYLIIDEVSMLSRACLAKMSRNISLLKTGSEEGEPFGGMNVIICGDFHQFPPVASKRNAPLYYPNDLADSKETVDDEMGRTIYEAFTTVVILREQVRVRDPTWNGFLQRLRAGEVDGDDVEMLRSLVLTHPKCTPTDFDREPWSNALLVTPRHTVRTQWNDAATKRHCARTGVQLFVGTAEDTIRGRPLSLVEQLMVAQKKSSQRRNKQDHGGLPREVQFAVGMKVMVTLNVDTDLDVANGTRGEIVDIVLDPREPAIANDRIVNLQYLPLYVLVRLEHTKASGLTGLAENVIPVEPLSRTFQVQVPIRDAEGQHFVSKTVTRRQFPMTAAYAFTDYRAQGQTIPCVIVDIASPPSGSDLTLFNIYVALSRSAGRETIRLLRDFDERLLFKPIDVALQVEDERLDKLDGETRRWWGRMKSASQPIM